MPDTLAEPLESFRTGWRERVPPELKEKMERHIAHLQGEGIAARALGVGDRAPAIQLKNQNGVDVDVSQLLAQGPVIVTFYRGGWCPFCNLELKAYQALLPRIAAAGAQLMAISPEKPDETVTTAEKNALAFLVLSDPGQAVGKAFGIVLCLHR